MPLTASQALIAAIARSSTLEVSTSRAQDFFAQLEAVSRIVRKRLAGSEALSPYGTDGWTPSKYAARGLPSCERVGPVAAVIHYTAGELRSVVSWFCRTDLGSQRAAHLVVARDLAADVITPAEVARAAPLVAALPALPVQVRTYEQTAIHSTWLNQAAYGVELVNLGFDPRPMGQTEGAYVVRAGRAWQPFTVAQVSTAATVLRMLGALRPDIGPDTTWGHEQVQMVQTPGCGGEDKRDPGPAFPWAEFRAALRGGLPPSETKGAPNLTDLALQVLGMTDGVATEQTRRVFQFAAGLTVDGQFGPKTQAALCERVRDRLGMGRPLTLEQVGKLAEMHVPPAVVLP